MKPLNFKGNPRPGEVVIIDSHAICHMAKHALKGVPPLTHNGQGTGIIMIFLTEILQYAKIIQTPDFVFAWDSRTSKRKEMNSEYKANRAEVTEDDLKAFQQFEEIKKVVLPMLGFKRSFEVEGYEGDDVIASIVQSNPHTPFTIVSSDSDLYQLLSNRVRMLMPRTKKFYTVSDFMKMYDCSPEWWAWIKAAMGDSSDNIAGIKGVGPITAIKYLKGQMRGQLIDKINNEIPMIMRNLRLIRLPLEGVGTFDILKKDELFIIDFVNVVKKYGMTKFLTTTNMDFWNEHFNMK